MGQTVGVGPRRVAVAALLLVAMLVVPGVRPRSALPDGETLLLPRHPDGRRVLVIYDHGAGGTSQAITADPELRPVVAALLEAGWAVAASDETGNGWGAPAAVRSVFQLYSDVNRRWPISNVVILSQSMGGLTGLGILAARAVPNVRAWAGIYPVTNLDSLWRLGRYRAQIAAAYGTASAPTSPHASCAVPVLMWASRSDTVVPRAENADMLASQLGGSCPVTIVTTSGDHGDPSNFDPPGLVAFCRSALSPFD